ncbi:LysR family transcriptional regulator [Luteibacter sp. 9133]|uniref:LysR family transcriptional regulator n=1 Tax=Luteibacter sp. 9133 TaxID=1500891 RepID=UPI0005BC55E6|nr:LysR family transcriptional regulator [Luteibacter sp. 9133]
MDMKRSDLSLLISLDTLLDELNVTRAAKRLNLSQPTLSGQLSRLREIFDDPLLVPAETGRGMVPTERALELRPRLAEALSGLRAALASSIPFDPRRSRRTFSISANDNLFTILGLGVLARVAAFANPSLRLSFVPVDEAETLAKMERGELDIALGLAGKMPGSLKSRSLLRDRFKVAQRRGHSRGSAAMDLATYCSMAHVMVSRRGHFQGALDAALEQHGRRRNVTLSVPSYNHVPLVLGMTDAIATLPGRMLARYEHELDLYDLPLDMPSFDLVMAWHPRAESDASHIWLRDMFIREASSLDA